MGIYRKRGRRLISLLLVFLMVFSLVPLNEIAQVFASEKPAISVGWKPVKEKVQSGDEGEIKLKVEIDHEQVENVGLRIRLTEEEAAAFIQFAENDEGVRTYVSGDHTWTLEKEEGFDDPFWILSVAGSVDEKTLEETFTVCIPKTETEQMIDVDPNTDVEVLYDGRSSAVYTDSDTSKATDSKAVNRTKQVKVDEDGIKVSIETEPMYFLASDLTEAVFPEISAEKSSITCVDGVANPDAKFEMMIPDTSLSYHLNLTAAGDLSFLTSVTTSSNAVFVKGTDQKLAEIEGLPDDMRFTKLSVSGETLSLGIEGTGAAAPETAEIAVVICTDSLKWEKKQTVKEILARFMGGGDDRVQSSEAETLNGTLTLSMGADGGTDAAATITLTRISGGDVTVRRNDYNLGPQKIFWIDNSDEDGIRPSSVSPELSYKLVAPHADWGEGDGTKLEPGISLAGVGLTKMPEPVITKNEVTSTWSVSYEGLPSTVVKDGVEYKVLWKWSQASIDGYSKREVNDDNIENYHGTVSEYGWYYLLRRNVTVKVDIRQGDSSYYDITSNEAAKYFKVCLYEKTATGELLPKETGADTNIATLLENGALKLIGEKDAKGNGLYEIRLGWKYNLNGNPFVYTIEWDGDKDENGKPLNRFHVAGMEDGDYIQASYDNSDTVGYQEVTDRLYSGGMLTLTLTGTQSYQATKIWSEYKTEQSEKERPSGEFELWRYPQRFESYTMAAPVYGENGQTMSIPLDTHPENNTQTITFGVGEDGVKTLPKYDTDGYPFAYVVKEYFTNDDSKGYEQLFGAYDEETGLYNDVFIKADGTTVYPANKDGKREDANNIYLYDGGTLYNRKVDTVTVSASKTWEAAAFQENFQGVTVSLGLESRTKEVKNSDGNVVAEAGEWTEVSGETMTLGDFNAVNLTRSGSRQMPRYDIYGRELEYRWVELDVAQTVDGAVRDTGFTDGTCTLKQNGRIVKYESSSEIASSSNAGSQTAVVNRIKDTVDYDVVKKWSGIEPGENTELHFRLYRFYSGVSIADATQGTPYLTFKMTKDGGVIATAPSGDGSENVDICVPEYPEPDAWSHVRIYGLPEFDESGHQYEYVLVEEPSAEYYAADIKTEKINEDRGYRDYKSTLVNEPGTGDNRIMVVKEWIDDGDIQHRRDVVVQAYQNGTNEPVGEPVELGVHNIWYSFIDIGNTDPADVYVLETKVLGADGEASEFTVTNPAEIQSAEDYSGQYGNVSLKHHRYEVTYKRSSLGNDQDVFVVSNRRLGNIDIDVEKKWNDGSGELRDKMKEALERYNTAHADSPLELALYLDFKDPEGTAAGGEITRNADPASGDTIRTDGHTNEVIYGSDCATPAKSVQILNLESHDAGAVTRSEHYAFYGIPKYNEKGQVVHYQVTERWVTKRSENGNPVYKKVADVKSLLESIPAENPVTGETNSTLWDLWSTYTRTTSEDYTVALDQPENTEVDRNDYQKITVSNSLTGVKTVHWHKLWRDAYSRKQNTRFDIYLTVLRRGRDENGNLKATLSESDVIIRDYRWVKTDQDSDEQRWTATIKNLPKYDENGYEIFYYAFERTEVDSNSLDYAIAVYAVPSASNADKIDVIGTAGGKGKPGDESYTEYDPTDKNVVLNPIDQTGSAGLPEYAGKYAVVEEGTIINSLIKDAKIIGSKSFQSLPNQYPAKDYPEITFVLDRYLGDPNDGGKLDMKEISEFTVKDWTTIKRSADGSYPIEIDNIGKYVYQLDADGNGVIVPVSGDETPNKGQKLPRYDGDGERYTYLLREKSVKGAGPDGKELLPSGTDDIVGGMGIYVRDDSANTTSSHIITNTYESPKGKLKVKKIMELPKNGETVIFPAVRFELTRSYTSYDRDGAAAVVDDTGFVKQTKTISSADVKAAYDALGAGKGNTVSLELVFDDLELYAPNGTDYLYTVTEVKKDFLDGYDTWGMAGDASSIAEITAAAESADKTTIGSLKATSSNAVATVFANKKWSGRKDDGSDKVELKFTKRWDDFGNAFQTRPEELTLKLERSAAEQPGQGNGIDWEEITVSSPALVKNETENFWTYTWTELERYAPNGMPWRYRVTESSSESDLYSASPRKTVEFSGNSDNTTKTAEIKNSVRASAGFTKLWTDENRNEVTSDYLGYSVKASFKLWAATSSDAVFDENAAAWMDADILFSTDAVKDAVLAANGNRVSWDMITSPYIEAGISDPVWKRGKAFVLPAAMDLGGQKVRLHYRYVETGVSCPVEGGTAAQTITETTPGAYTVTGDGLLKNVTITKTAENGVKIINQTTLKSFAVSKVWNDSGDAYGSRAGETRMILLYRAGDAWKAFQVNGSPVIVTLWEKNHWTASINGLPGELEYRMRELPLDGDGTTWIDEDGTFTGTADYKVTYEDTAVNTIVTNTLKTNPDPENGDRTLTLYVEKKWGGSGSAPITLKLQYRINGDDGALGDWKDVGTREYAMDGTADAANNGAYWEFDSWKFKITNLPAFQKDKPVAYRVLEKVPDGFKQVASTEKTITDTDFDPAGTGQSTQLFTFVNTRETSFEVTKEWIGTVAAGEISVDLYRRAGEDGAEERFEGKTAVLNDANHFKNTWDDLPAASADGEIYEYFVREVQVPDGYRAEYGEVEKAADGTYKQTVYNVPLTSISGTKVWKDEHGSDDSRPAEISLILERSTDSNAWKRVDIGTGETPAALSWDKTTDPDRWTYQFDGLDKYSLEGEAYQYRVTEESVSGYHTVYTGSNALYAGDGDQIINTKVGEHTFVFDKIWKDAGEAQRPDEISLSLYRRTAETDAEIVSGVLPAVSKNGELWTYTYDGLPSHDDDGRAYTYWVTEKPVNGYDTVYSDGDRAENCGTITNVARGGLSVGKTVTGNGGEKHRKFKFTVVLSGTSDTGINAGTFTNGKFVNGIVEISLKDGEIIRFEDLPAGFTYTVAEADDAKADGYTVTAAGETGIIPAGDVAEARFENRKEEEPTQPTVPVTPTEPSLPTVPVSPTEPADPTKPSDSTRSWHHDSDDSEDETVKKPTKQDLETTSSDETVESQQETNVSEVETISDTEASTDTSTEKDRKTRDEDNPKTGDSSHTWIWIVFAALSAVIMIIFRRMRDENNGKSE